MSSLTDVLEVQRRKGPYISPAQRYQKQRENISWKQRDKDRKILHWKMSYTLEDSQFEIKEYSLQIYFGKPRNVQKHS